MSDSPAERARKSFELRIGAVLDLGEGGDGLRSTAHMANPIAIPVRVVLEPGAGPGARGIGSTEMGPEGMEPEGMEPGGRGTAAMGTRAGAGPAGVDGTDESTKYT